MSNILNKEKDIDKVFIVVSKEFIYGSNMRVSKEYRKDMVSVLVKRMYNVIEEGMYND